MHCSFRTISLAKQLFPFHAKIRDVSQDGLCLVANRFVEPGTFLAIHPQSSRQQVPSHLRGQVVHATFVPGNRQWIIGCSLGRELSHEELVAFL